MKKIIATIIFSLMSTASLADGHSGKIDLEGFFQADAKMSADKKYQSLQKQLKKVAVEGTIQDEMRFIFSE